MDGQRFARQIEGLLASRGIGKNQFYKDCKLSNASFFQWSSGKFNPSPRSVNRIATYFGISSAYFVERERQTHESSEQIKAIANIPIIASAENGHRGPPIEDASGDVMQIPASILKGKPEEECRAMRICGNSMYPSMKDGDVVVIHIQKDVENGKVAVCIVDKGTCTIKRFFRYRDRVELRPDNPRVPKLILTGRYYESFRIYGQAIALIRDDL